MSDLTKMFLNAINSYEREKHTCIVCHNRFYGPPSYTCGKECERVLNTVYIASYKSPRSALTADACVWCGSDEVEDERFALDSAFCSEKCMCASFAYSICNNARKSRAFINYVGINVKKYTSLPIEENRQNVVVMNHELIAGCEIEEERCVSCGAIIYFSKSSRNKVEYGPTVCEACYRRKRRSVTPKKEIPVESTDSMEAAVVIDGKEIPVDIIPSEDPKVASKQKVDEYTSSQAYTSTHRYDGVSPALIPMVTDNTPRRNSFYYLSPREVQDLRSRLDTVKKLVEPSPLDYIRTTTPASTKNIKPPKLVWERVLRCEYCSRRLEHETVNFAHRFCDEICYLRMKAFKLSANERMSTRRIGKPQIITVCSYLLCENNQCNDERHVPYRIYVKDIHEPSSSPVYEKMPELRKYRRRCNACGRFIDILMPPVDSKKKPKDKVYCSDQCYYCEHDRITGKVKKINMDYLLGLKEPKRKPVVEKFYSRCENPACDGFTRTGKARFCSVACRKAFKELNEIEAGRGKVFEADVSDEKWNELCDDILSMDASDLY